MRRRDGVGALLMSLMCAILAWRTGVGTRAVYDTTETSMILALPMWWVYAMLAPGLTLPALVALFQAWLHLRGLPMTELQMEVAA